MINDPGTITSKHTLWSNEGWDLWCLPEDISYTHLGCGLAFINVLSTKQWLNESEHLSSLHFLHCLTTELQWLHLHLENYYLEVKTRFIKPTWMTVFLGKTDKSVLQGKYKIFYLCIKRRTINGYGKTGVMNSSWLR